MDDVRFPRMARGIKLTITIALVWGLAGGCDTQNQESQEAALYTRPQLRPFFLSTIRLATPALLSPFTKNRTQVLEVLLREQEVMTKQLANLSPDIVVIYRYRLVFNGLTVKVPWHLRASFEALMEGSAVESFEPQDFNRAEPIVEDIGDPFALMEEGDQRAGLLSRTPHWGETSSVGYIGAVALHQKYDLKGQGMRVGVVDSGVDYTHIMFGGSGDVESYQSNDPRVLEPGSFPTERVVGGWDFVGSHYASGSTNYDLRIPNPDPDPLDETGHGTHVAGTIAGSGLEGISYDGVAPQADIYALKVFGAAGTTNESVVMAALEFAADPNQDLDPSDRLDVVNLSIGSSYGRPEVAYHESIANITAGGTLVVASAGNAGDRDYVVSSPSINDEALSVAASVDAMNHNWRQRALEFILPEGETRLVATKQSPIAIKNQDAEVDIGNLVFVGSANEPLVDDLAQAVKGNVALVDRGGVNFCLKGQHVRDAGAVGMIVAHNKPGEESIVGGECRLEIPATMIRAEFAAEIKAILNQAGKVAVNYKDESWIEQPRLIDTIAAFSSKGPRSLDGVIKPEITAPGKSIISAKVGSGKGVSTLSGTSMAAPHVAGAALLLRQFDSKLSPLAAKSLLMTSSSPLIDFSHPSLRPFPISRQGSGRVNVEAALKQPLIAQPGAVSLGHLNVLQGQTLVRNIQLSLRPEAVHSPQSTRTATVSFINEGGLVMEGAKSIILTPHQVTNYRLKISIKDLPDSPQVVEYSGRVLITVSNNGSLYNDVVQIPVMGLVKPIGNLESHGLSVEATSPADADGALATFEVKNQSPYPSPALFFNLLGQDTRKELASTTETIASYCDLELVGYRMRSDSTEHHGVLELGFKTYQSNSHWSFCEPSVQFDTDGDGLANFELVGDLLSSYQDVAAEQDHLAGVLLDVKTALALVRARDLGTSTDSSFAPAVAAIGEYRVYPESSIALMSIPVDRIISDHQDIRLKFALLSDASGSEADDFLADHKQSWQTIPAGASEHPLVFFEDERLVGGFETASLEMALGSGDRKNAKLLVLVPQGAGTRSLFGDDGQALVVVPTFRGQN